MSDLKVIVVADWDDLGPSLSFALASMRCVQILAPSEVEALARLREEGHLFLFDHPPCQMISSDTRLTTERIQHMMSFRGHPDQLEPLQVKKRSLNADILDAVHQLSDLRLISESKRKRGAQWKQERKGRFRK